MTTPWRRARFLLLCLILLPGILVAAAGATTEERCEVTLCQLQRMSECELERLFESAPLGCPPCGCFRGHILCVTDGKLPRLRAKLAGSVWRGKCFADDGCFINQFLGVKAITSRAAVGPSWHDGKPCHVLEYAPKTPLFGNNRDEFRQVGCNLYLGPLYERCPCPKRVAFLGLEVKCK